MKIVLEESSSFFTLYEQDGEYYLSVVCGRAAVFTVDIQLSEHEVDRFQKEGAEYVERLANSVMASPEQFENRLVELPA